MNDSFLSLFEFLPIGAYRSLPNGRMLRANPALVRINGCDTEAELVAMVQDIAREWYVDPSRREAFVAEMDRNGSVMGFESEMYRHKTRERTWIRENAHAVRDDQGHILFYEGTVEEIANEVQARQALARSREQLRQIGDLLPGLIYHVTLLPDGGRKASYVSAGARELLELDPEDVFRDGQLMHQVRHVEDRPAIEAATSEAARTGSRLTLEYRVQLPSGQVKWVHMRSAAAPQEDGLDARVGLVLDITSRKLAELELLRSEARLQQLVALIPGVVFRMKLYPDGTRRYSYVSDHVRALYGLEPQEVLADGEALVNLRHPQDAESVRQRADAAMDADQALDYEVRIRLRDGTVKWVQVISAPAPPEDDGRVRIGVILDVTERKTAEAAVQAQAELWKSALEAGGDGVWDWRIAQGVEMLSPQCKALYGFEPHELSDSPDALDSRTHADDLLSLKQAREDHFAGRTARYVSEHRVRCKDGQWKWILSRGLVISRDAAGRPLRMVGTHTDVTAAKQAQALRQERDRAAAADLAKSQFLSRVSHELRTPLNAILGFSQLLELEPVMSERQRHWNRQVLDSGRHLLALMDDILDMSSGQTSQLVVTAEPVSVRAIVREAWVMVDSGANEKAVTLTNEIPDSNAAQMLGDRRRIKQIISNLLSNAVKYNRAQGWVRVELHAADRFWALSVVDGGPGLDEAQQARLFNAFDRLGAERSAVQGTGLGLALSRQLAQAMGGDISAACQPGRGCTFTLRLPRA